MFIESVATRRLCIAPAHGPTLMHIWTSIHGLVGLLKRNYKVGKGGKICREEWGQYDLFIVYM